MFHISTFLVVTYPDGTKKTVVSTVTVTLKGNSQDSPGCKAPQDTTQPLGGGGSRAPSSSSKAGFSKQALDAHNKYRAKHHAPPLKWSDEIAKDAQAWAEKLARARSLQHASQSERKGTGENIAMFSGKFESAGDEATNMWYAEVKDYRFDKPGFQGNTGHFTQVVWKESKELGMGRAQTADGRLTFVVARYKPPGNLLNHFQENVFKG
ncbi:Golgi-associated plant pathogenesis-related protein 1-like [Orbicella faveolata]|uniref:Golgi-associated plant pathogenesis-related protein 1-like n=1 Tax=Orbicella faveolata TaxID=48498 RepID=UPI0009E225BA|nr:Golgi-associated plant pathogenesis-related protein 1-like [Orbicella faveolata]